MQIIATSKADKSKSSTANSKPIRKSTLEQDRTQIDEKNGVDGDIGNHAYGDIPIESPNKGAPTPIIQPKLVVGAVDDPYEKEADRMAKQVVQQLNRPVTAPEILQRVSEQESLAATIQPQVGFEGGPVSGSTEREIRSEQGGGRPLETKLQAQMGQAMGADFSKVRVHTNSRAHQLSQSIQAKAFTTGHDLFFGQGEYTPTNTSGQELIAHELTHVVQQNPDIVSRSPVSKFTPSHEQVQRDDTIADKAGRVKRIVARFFQKSLPINTYRWDTRAPETIAQTGFQPWKADGNIRLDEHVNNVLDNGDLAKHESQWVSTGAYGMVQKLDPTFAQQVLESRLYKVDTATASETGDFHDVNDYFDRRGEERPYASQREWAKEGGVPPQSVIAWMKGEDFVDQYDFETGAPSESELTGWNQMPAPTT